MDSSSFLPETCNTIAEHVVSKDISRMIKVKRGSYKLELHSSCCISGAYLKQSVSVCTRTCTDRPPMKTFKSIFG